MSVTMQQASSHGSDASSAMRPGSWHPAMRPNSEKDISQPPTSNTQEEYLRPTVHVPVQQHKEQPTSLDAADDSRFEEGLPLLSPAGSSESDRGTRHKRMPSLDPFADEPAEGDDFFAQLSSQPPNGFLQNADRKSTADVIESLGFVAEEDQEDPLFDDTTETDPDAAFFSEKPKTEPIIEAVPAAAIWGDSDDEELLEEMPTADPFFDDDDDLLEDQPIEYGSKTLLDEPTNLTQGTHAPVSKYAPSAGISTIASQLPSQYGQTQQAWAAEPPKSSLQTAQSFADKAKGGYASPYDLPMELGPKPPKKRMSMQQLSSNYSLEPQRSTAPRSVSMAPPVGVGSSGPPQTTPSPYQTAPGSSRPASSASGFFEDLPVARPKQRASHAGLYQLSQNASTPPGRSPYAPVQQTAPPTIPQTLYNSGPGVNPPAPQLTSYNPSPPVATQPASQPLYDQLAHTQSSAPAARSSTGPTPSQAPPAVSSTRYSPNPSQMAQGSPAKPANGQPPMPSLLPHQPRNSSPLAYSRPSQNNYATQPPLQTGSPEERSSYAISRSSDEEPRAVPGYNTASLNGRYAPPGPQNLNGSRNSLPQPTVPLSTVPTGGYGAPVHAPQSGAAYPTRTLTQSPASISASYKSQSAPSGHHRLVSDTHSKESNSHLQFILPTDGTEHDPLQRWKGKPIFSWGFGGSVVTSFPSHVQRFTSQAQAMIKCTSGDVNIKSVKNVLPLEDGVLKFPGPLKNKGQKKDVLAWLRQSIEAFEQSASAESYDELRRNEERIMLWKIVLLLVEKDGVLETSSEAVRDILSVQAAQGFISSQLQNPPVQSDVRDLDAIRSQLLFGEREKAVWDAVDKRLWAHALLISSTMSRELWKRVVQEFVKLEVRPLGENAGSLAALYEVFGGNWEDSIDQLVPASARAGLAMVDQETNAISSRSNLDGLDSWRDTLALILSNRSPDDQHGIMALGNLLASCGRTEASHICYLFARPYAVFGGADDPRTTFTLLGRSQLIRVSESAELLDNIRLSEIYEFALTLDGASKPSPSPHLQGFRLIHAMNLAEHGLSSDAQAYCDALSAAFKSVKSSPYYHSVLFSEYDNLAKRLQLSPKDNTSSWKPSMEKVSGSMWAKFNSFVAGDDDPTAQTGSTANEVGPFSNVPGGGQTISRSESRADMYGSYSSEAFRPAGTASPAVGGGRYAPTNSYDPRSSQELTRAQGYEPAPAESYQPSYQSQQYGGYNPHPVSTIQQPYEPQPVAGSTAAMYPEKSQAQPQYSAPNGYSPYNAGSQTQSHEAVDTLEQSSYEASTGYNPNSGYEPQQPDASQEDAENEGNQRPKKSFMDDDDDDDLLKRAAKLAKDQKEKPAKAEESKDRPSQTDTADRKSWFGGWFGKKDPSLSQGPIKAKLGEQMSLYYDPELKRWVNPNDKGGETKSTSTPPPPKGPSRAASASLPPSSGQGTPQPPPPPANTPGAPPKSSTPLAQSSQPPATPLTGTPPPNLTPVSQSALPNNLQPPETASGPPSRPPSRPATSMSNASSIDDLIGTGPRRSGGTVGRKAKAKRGYVDVMAK
jgi:hypothetical protein